MLVHGGHPARVHERAGIGLLDDRGTVDDIAAQELGAVEHRGRATPPASANHTSRRPFTAGAAEEPPSGNGARRGFGVTPTAASRTLTSSTGSSGAA